MSVGWDRMLGRVKEVPLLPEYSQRSPKWPKVYRRTHPWLARASPHLLWTDVLVANKNSSIYRQNKGGGRSWRDSQVSIQGGDDSGVGRQSLTRQSTHIMLIGQGLSCAQVNGNGKMKV